MIISYEKFEDTKLFLLAKTYNYLHEKKNIEKYARTISALSDAIEKELSADYLLPERPAETVLEWLALRCRKQLDRMHRSDDHHDTWVMSILALYFLENCQDERFDQPL